MPLKKGSLIIIQAEREYGFAEKDWRGGEAPRKAFRKAPTLRVWPKKEGFPAGKAAFNDERNVRISSGGERYIQRGFELRNRKMNAEGRGGQNFYLFFPGKKTGVGVAIVLWRRTVRGKEKGSSTSSERASVEKKPPAHCRRGERGRRRCKGKNAPPTSKKTIHGECSLADR